MPKVDSGGTWSEVRSLPVLPIHTTLLPDGKLLMWGRHHNGDYPVVYDLATQTYVSVPSPANDIFCTHQNYLADGTLLTAGGHITDGDGTADLLKFDPERYVWTRLPDMEYRRWYPNTIFLPDGRIFIVAGSYYVDGVKYYANKPEVYDPELNSLTTKTDWVPSGVGFYPDMYVAPDNILYMNRPAKGYRYLKYTATNAKWTGTDTNTGSGWAESTFAQYRPGKVYGVGSVADATSNKQGFFDVTSRYWTALPNSINGRRDCDLTILADGKLLVTGGSVQFAKPSNATVIGEIIDPDTNSITQTAPAAILRTYHSSAVLLPDGSVFKGGSGEGGTSENIRQANYEIYYPPYYSRADRPVLQSYPKVLTYGSTYPISFSSSHDMRYAALIRLGSATHSINYSQNYVPVNISTTSEGSTITLTTNKAELPPGPYMLLVVDSDNLPSRAAMVTVGSLASPGTLTSMTSSGDITNLTPAALSAVDGNTVAVNAVVNALSKSTASIDIECVNQRRLVSSFQIKSAVKGTGTVTVQVSVYNNFLGTYEPIGSVAVDPRGAGTIVNSTFMLKEFRRGKEFVDSDKKSRIRLTFTSPTLLLRGAKVEIDQLQVLTTY